MKVLVAGAGQVGLHIARYLAGTGYDVTIVDQRADIVQKIGDSLDIQALVGHASHPSVLAQAGAADADMLIAVTQVDEVNMVACNVAHTLFNVPTKIARIRQQAYLESRWQDLFRSQHVPIDVIISPEVEVARAIALRLEVPGAVNCVPFAEDRVRLLAIRAGTDCPVNNTPLRQLTYLFPDLHLVVVAIGRGERFFVPDADDEILEGDEVHCVIETALVDRALSVFGYEERLGDRLIIGGGGNVGIFLARELEQRHPELGLKLIEADPIRAEVAAERLKRAVVLRGDIRERAVLEEASIAAASAFVTVTNNDEVNIIASLLGKRLGCRRSLALVNNSTYGLINLSIGIDVAINPRDITVSSILQHVRRGRIKAVHAIGDGEAEVYEAEALETSQLVGKPLREARLAGGIIVGAVVRKGEVIMPRGDTLIRGGDRVILAARKDMVRRVQQLFAVRLDYF
jgi:trk system potassium uptake protein TrkA